MRVLRTVGIYEETEYGCLEGEIWSDGLAAVRLKTDSGERDGEAQVASSPELADLLASAGVPAEDAASLAERIWRERMEPRTRDSGRAGLPVRRRLRQLLRRS